MKIEYLKENNVDIEKSLELLGDIETYNEILDEFYNEINNRMERLNTAKENDDVENYTIDVHALKSDAKYLGFNHLASIALEHQEKGEKKDIEYIKNHYEELKQEVDKIINIIKKYKEE